MFLVYFTNFGGSSTAFNNMETAIKYMKESCFESTLMHTKTGEILGRFNPISLSFIPY